MKMNKKVYNMIVLRTIVYKLIKSIIIIIFRMRLKKLKMKFKKIIKYY